MEKQKLSFFKKVKTSVLDFDGYQSLAAEKISRTIIYIVLILLIFSIVISVICVCQFWFAINKLKNYVNTEISEIKYENYELSIIPSSGEKTIEIENSLTGQPMIIIDTEANEEETEADINKIESQENGILLLKDRIIIKNELLTKTEEYSYKTISEKYNINKIDKEELIKMLSGREIISALALLGVALILYMFIVFISNILIDIFVLALLAYIVSRIAGLRLKYSAIYNIATYSLTLPLILNIIYVIVNALTGFTIEYFNIMYNAIASIYIITAMLMIKSDVIKKQFELNKIIEEQAKVREELKRREEEKKKQEEEERKRKEQEKEKEKEEKRKKREEKKEEGEISKEPEGDNA